MKYVVGFFGALLLLFLEGCAVDRGYGGAYDEYPYGSYGHGASAPVYGGGYYYPNYRYRQGPYDRDHYWDRHYYWDRQRYPQYPRWR